jgi:GTP cyclohydrolase II
MHADDPRTAAMAIDALRRGWPICMAQADGTMLRYTAVESTSDAALAELDRAGPAALLISHQRAATLNIVNQRAAAGGEDVPVILSRMSGDSLSRAIAIADPARDLAYPFKGPFDAAADPAPAASVAAVRLARRAGMLPAFFVQIGPAQDGDIVTTPAAVAAFADPARIAKITQARLPIAGSESAEIIAFRSPEDPADHIALIIGQRDGSAPLVRVHSECLTGDVFGSLKCDCGPQLHHAIARMAGAQWGILLYLRQEGRGIGLINKLRAYQLQDQGFDTVEANVRLGFPVEARDFGIAAQMLRLLSVPAVRLLTNNPGKVAKLTAEGIEVAERVPHSLPANAHNAHYLSTKRDKTGHML